VAQPGDVRGLHRSLLTTLLWRRQGYLGGEAPAWSFSTSRCGCGHGDVWLFANFDEELAEERSKAQGGGARGLKQTCGQGGLSNRASCERGHESAREALRRGDGCYRSRRLRPADGEVIQGAASVVRARSRRIRTVIRESVRRFSAGHPGGHPRDCRTGSSEVTVNSRRDLPRPHDSHGGSARRQRPETRSRSTSVVALTLVSCSPPRR